MAENENVVVVKERRSHWWAYTVLVALLIGVAAFGYNQYTQRVALQQQMENQYNRAFFDLTGYVENVEKLLLKSLITTQGVKTASLLQEAWRQANLAQENLSILPISQEVLGDTSKFLVQVGDMSNALNLQNINGKKISSEQFKTLESLHGYAVSLEDALNQLQKDVNGGRLRWMSLNKGQSTFQKTSNEMSGKPFEGMGKTFQEYPRLIYDGPFSDHMVSNKPRGLIGPEVTQEQARQKVTTMLGQDRVKEVKDAGKNEGNIIKTYTYNVSFKGRPENEYAQVEMTMQGGMPYMMLYNRQIGNETLSVEKAKEAAKKFLDQLNFKGMVDTYYLKEDGVAVINYAYKQNNVVAYADLIKVKVALDNGEILGFESKSYLNNHITRTLPAPKITLEQAKSMINQKVKLSSTGLALAPTNYNTENFCYELKGKYNNNDFIVYINAETGKEEDVLMIVNTPEGILTQ